MVGLQNIIISSILAIAAMAAPTVPDQESSSSLVRRKNTNKCEAHIHIDCKSEQSLYYLYKRLTPMFSLEWSLYWQMHRQVQDRPPRQFCTCPAYG
jgi:hypothetical protein